MGVLLHKNLTLLQSFIWGNRAAELKTDGKIFNEATGSSSDGRELCYNRFSSGLVRV